MVDLHVASDGVLAALAAPSDTALSSDAPRTAARAIRTERIWFPF